MIEFPSEMFQLETIKHRIVLLKPPLGRVDKQTIFEMTWLVSRVEKLENCLTQLTMKPHRFYLNQELLELIETALKE